MEKVEDTLVLNDRPGTLLRVDGELDCSCGPRLRSLCEPHLAGGSSVVLLDTSEVSFIDCSGLRQVLLITTRLRAHQIELRLVEPSPAVQRLASLTGTQEALGLQHQVVGASAPPRQRRRRVPAAQLDTHHGAA